VSDRDRTGSAPTKIAETQEEVTGSTPAASTYNSTGYSRKSAVVPTGCPSEGWLYFIQSGPDGPVKIGVATDLKKRPSMLQVGNPAKLKIVAALPLFKGGAPGELAYTERHLHRQLRPARVRGEWFDGKTVRLFVRYLIEAMKENGVDFAGI